MKKFVAKVTYQRGDSKIELWLEDAGPRTVAGMIEDHMRDLQPGHQVTIEVERPAPEGSKLTRQFRIGAARSGV